MAQQTGSSSSGGAGALPRILLLNPNTNTGMTESMAAVARSTGMGSAPPHPATRRATPARLRKDLKIFEFITTP